MEISESIRDRAIGLLTSFRNETSGDIGVDAALTKPSFAIQLSNTKNKISECVSLGSNAQAVGESVALIGDYTHLSDGEVRSLIGWLNKKVTLDGVSKGTAKCYRRWLASYFESVEDPCTFPIRNWVVPSSQETALLKGDGRQLHDPKLNKLPGTPVAGHKANTRYHTYFERETLILLIRVLMSERRGKPRYAKGDAAALFFFSTMMLGLRPKEWTTAQYRETYFDPEQKITLGPMLDVWSLKQHNRREDNPLRERRYLVLDKWPPKQLNILKSFLEIIATLPDEAAADSFYNGVRMTLYRAWNQVKAANQNPYKEDMTSGGSLERNELPHLPTHLINSNLSVSLYTARHIFAEECRRSRGLTRFELATLLGHSMLTNQFYYGPRQENAPRGYEYILPRPWPGDADDIMAWDNTVNPRRNQFGQGDLFADPQTELDQDAIETLWDQAERSTVPLRPHN